MTISVLAVSVITAFAVHGVAAVPQAAAVVRIDQASRDSGIVIRFVNSDLRAAVEAMGQYLDRPVVFVSSGPTQPVTFETPKPVSRSDVPRLLRGLLESQAFELFDDTVAHIFRARPREQKPASPTTPIVRGPGEHKAEPELFVIDLHHARALEVAATVNLLFGRGSPSGGAGVLPQTLSEQLRANRAPPEGAAPIQAVPGTVGRAAVLSGDLVIVPDPRANSLLVRANRMDFDLIRAAIAQLDVRPLQVLIELLIVEVSRNSSLELSLDGSALPQHVRGTDNTLVGGSQVGGAGLGGFALSVMGLGGVDLDATLRAAASRGEARIVSRPVVLAANNTEAEVVVGSQRPFVQIARSLPTETALQDQIVQYKDVGTRLLVRPTISTDGSVQLDVVQEISSATNETAFNAPVIATRSVRTNLLVQDGQTVALGGLTDRQRESQQTGVPILSSIPILGGLFGHASRQSTETELFLFITPHVIRTEEDATGVSDALRKRAGEIKP